MTTTPKLLGTYRTPRFNYGDVVSCARLGEVRITALTDGPIPWPVGQRLRNGRRPAIILYAGLGEAVRRESASAVAHHWGVTAQTVSLWRRTLGVGVMTEGTTKLKSDVHAPNLVAAREASLPTLGSPERRAKIAASKRGKPRPPHVVEAVRKAHVGKKHSEETRQKMREAHARRRQNET